MGFKWCTPSDSDHSGMVAVQTSTPQAPTTTSSVADWTKALPDIYKTQLQYEPLLMQNQINMQQLMNAANAPLQAQQAQAQQQWAEQMLQQQMAGQATYGKEMAQQQMDLQLQYAPQMLQQQYEAQLKYAPQLTQSQYDISKQLYPETVGLQEQLAQTASQNMNQSVPDWYNQNVRENLKSTLGRNLVYNPQAQESYGIKTAQAQDEWKRYYANMALSVTGRQPLTQPATVNNPQVNMQQYNPSTYNQPQYQGTNWSQGYTPNAVMSGNNQNYGTAGSIYGSQLTAYNQSQNKPNPWANAMGSIGGNMLGSWMGGGGGGGGGMGYNTAGMDYYNNNSGSNYFGNMFGY